MSAARRPPQGSAAAATLAASGAAAPAPLAPAATPGSPPGAPSAAGANLLFLREEEIRLGQDLLFFAYRAFTNAADVILDELGLGRAHHRALHFIGRHPGITVSDLLGLLRITKQSLARVLSELVARGYVAQEPGSADRRQRLLTLTPEGMTLERRLFERQRDRLSAAYRDAGAASVDGFRRVMRAIMDDAARCYLDRAEASGRAARPR